MQHSKIERIEIRHHFLRDYAQILWMKQTLSDFDLSFEHVPIKCDNTSAISISRNPVQYSKTKHIEIRYHFLRNHA